MSSTVRISIALVVQVVAILFALMSWIDPLEGGAAMVLSSGLMAVVLLISRVKMPKLTWITIATGAATIVLFFVFYLAEVPPTVAEQATWKPSETIFNLIWVYRVAAVAFLSGVVFYAVVLFTARRSSKSAGDK